MAQYGRYVAPPLMAIVAIEKKNAVSFTILQILPMNFLNKKLNV